MGTAERILIVGIGNLLLGDEGLGVHVAGALRAGYPPLPRGVEVVEAGTSLLDVLPELGRCDRVILVDAIRAGGVPGSTYRLDLSANLRAGGDWRLSPALSLHELAVDDALVAAKALGLLPSRVELIGAEPHSLEPGLVLSPAVARAATDIVAMIEAEVGPRCPDRRD